MTVLATTLASALRHADAHFRGGRTILARRAYEELLQRAQARTDHPMEVVCRAMLARCAVATHDLPAAEDQLEAAGRLVDPHHAEGQRRVRTARVYWIREARPEEAASALDAFVDWAERESEWSALLEGLQLQAEALGGRERAERLERAVVLAREHGAGEQLLRLWFQLAGARELIDDTMGAMEAWRSAHDLADAPRDTVMAGWGLGALLTRQEDWPAARALLEETVREAEAADDCDDLLCFVLAELAQVNEAAGDVVEARHLLVRSLELAEAQDLAALWPAKWAALLEYSKRLEL